MSGPAPAALAAALGAEVLASRRIAGGDVNDALRVELADGRTAFVKYRAGADPDMFRAEARGLGWLAQARAVRTPAVLALGAGPPPFLALEWIDAGPGAPAAGEVLGRGLADLHRAGAPAFGAPADNWIGPLPQPNAALADWPGFYAERRLMPMAALAHATGALPAEVVAAIERVCGRLGELCGPPEPPARLHGDLWAGNAMLDSAGQPVLIDPAPYGGHREIDLAMMRLFGGFSTRCFAAYAEAHPPAAGHEDRVALYQLYPRLVHVALFGAAYLPGLRAGVARYG